MFAVSSDERRKCESTAVRAVQSDETRSRFRPDRFPLQHRQTMTDLLNDEDGEFGYSIPLEMKFHDGGDTGSFSGYAASFGLDLTGDKIAPGAFSETLAQHSMAGTQPALLWGHNRSRPIGVIKNLAEDTSGLRMDAKFALSTAAGRDAYGHAKEGSARGLSIGFVIPKNGSHRNQDGTRTLTNVHVHEISQTPMPANSQARIMGVKSLASPAELERLLREGGLSRRAAEKIAGPGFAALSGNPEQKSLDLNRVADLLREQTLAIKSWS
jgi:HK97 family phage prohead protease